MKKVGEPESREAMEARVSAQVEAIDVDCSREVDMVVLHCSATPEGRDVSAAEIRRWHVEERGFEDIGYHFVVRLDGTVERGRDLNRPGAHCKGFNRRSIGVCYVGGDDAELQSKDTRTEAQKAALTLLVERLVKRYPRAVVRKHRELAATKCPGF